MRLLLFVSCLLALKVAGQSLSSLSIEKPMLDSAAIATWPKLERGTSNTGLSPDGRYVIYKVNNEPMGSSTLYVRSSDGQWQRRYVGASKVCFSADSRQLVLSIKDTLLLLELGTDKVRSVAGVRSYKVARPEQANWLVRQERDKGLVALELTSGQERRYGLVEGYWLGHTGRALLMQTGAGKGHAGLSWIDLPGGRSHEVYQGDTVLLGSADFDNLDEQLVFTLGEQTAAGSVYSIWHYKLGMEKAERRATDQTVGVSAGLHIQPSVELSGDGRYVYCRLREWPTPRAKPKPGYVKMNIWNYQDSILQSAQLLSGEKPGAGYAAALGLWAGAPVVQLEETTDDFLRFKPLKGDYVLVSRHNLRRNGDRFWMKLIFDNYLVSLRDGARRRLKQSGYNSDFSFSPNGRFMICYDQATGRYMSYDLERKGEAVDICAGAAPGIFVYFDEYGKNTAQAKNVGIAGWVKNDEGMLVYDNYDIWLLDPSGRKSAVNITHGYGRRSHTRLRLEGKDRVDIVSMEEPLLLVGYNTQTKYNGFYQAWLNRKADPMVLTMGPYTYNHIKMTGLHDAESGMNVVKAAGMDAWLVLRQSYDEAPNFYLTSDFKEYRPVSNLVPHKGYRWLKAELVSWRQLDGTVCQGILYKPENMDASRKYPVLINYYQEVSQEIYEYKNARWTNDAFINIPWFVSRGYLVFTPDIHLTKEVSGASAYNSVVSGALYLSKRRFVDGKRMAIAGHSFAGGLTNYLVTHTNLFAAAFEGAGVSDGVSGALQLTGNGKARLAAHEGSCGWSIWQRPEIYMKNSPVLRADKVTTPLLMFHCKPDGAVPFEQAIELFVALRRLDKKVWLLQYDDGDHALVKKDDMQDLTRRVEQFFGVYLKGEPVPEWMSRGVPANEKGINSGLRFSK